MNDIAHSASPTITIGVRWGARILSAWILLFWGFFIVAHLVGDENHGCDVQRRG